MLDAKQLYIYIQHSVIVVDVIPADINFIYSVATLILKIPWKPTATDKL
jgi:hypothetical protein